MKNIVLIIMIYVSFVNLSAQSNNSNFESKLVNKLHLINIEVNGCPFDTIWSLSYKSKGRTDEYILNKPIKKIEIGIFGVCDSLQIDTLELTIPYVINKRKKVLLPVVINIDLIHQEPLIVELFFPRKYFSRKKHRKLFMYSYYIHYSDVCKGADCILHPITDKCNFKIIDR